MPSLRQTHVVQEVGYTLQRDVALDKGRDDPERALDIDAHHVEDWRGHP